MLYKSGAYIYEVKNLEFMNWFYYNICYFGNCIFEFNHLAQTCFDAYTLYRDGAMYLFNCVVI